jgi:hypothetical protein
MTRCRVEVTAKQAGVRLQLSVSNIQIVTFDFHLPSVIAPRRRRANFGIYEGENVCNGQGRVIDRDAKSDAYDAEERKQEPEERVGRSKK